MSITGSLPKDVSNRYFAGPGGFLPAGTQIGSTDYAVPHVYLVNIDDSPLIVGVANGATDSGNPLKIGGKAETTAPTPVTDGQRIDAWFDQYGRLVTTLKDTSGNVVGIKTVGADGESSTANSLRVANRAQKYNGATYDEVKNNAEGTLLASAGHVAATTTVGPANTDARGILLSINFTITPNNTETITPKLAIKDPVSSNYVIVTAFSTLTASVLGAAPAAGTALFLYTIYPGALETAAVGQHEVQALALPRSWEVIMTPSASGSWTYSIGYCFLK